MLATILATHGLTARAQDFVLPGPYGSAYWSGWGASTVPGDVARGLGVFAAGAGFYNRATAEATAIDAATAMRINEYLWLAERNRGLRYRYKLMASHARTVAYHRALDTRLHSAPEPRDVRTGAALNVLLGDLTRPSVYADRLPEAWTRIRCDLIREIPLNYAPGGVTVSLNELTRGGGAAVRAQRFQTAVVARDQRPFLEFATRAERNPQMTLAALIGFMGAFDLRFGEAQTPSQRAAYEALYPALSRLHEAAFGAPAPQAEVAAK
jgi:hypothetical protein